jgi:hypothetical protein
VNQSGPLLDDSGKPPKRHQPHLRLEAFRVDRKWNASGPRRLGPWVVTEDTEGALVDAGSSSHSRFSGPSEAMKSGLARRSACFSAWARPSQRSRRPEIGERVATGKGNWAPVESKLEDPKWLDIFTSGVLAHEIPAELPEPGRTETRQRASSA